MIYGGSQAGSRGGAYGTEQGSTWGVDFPQLDTGWWLDDVVADALVGPHPTVTRGEEATFTAKFSQRANLDPAERYEEIRDRCKWCHAVVNRTLIDGTPKFKEQHQEEPGTLVIDFRPGYGSQASTGFYGLITGYTDNTIRANQQAILELQVRVLADREEYVDKDALMADLAIE